MTPFKIAGMEVRYDTLIGIVFVLVTMVSCTFAINHKLTVNARWAAERDAADREVLLAIVGRLNDEQQTAKEISEITIKNKELEVKLENNFQMLQECAAAVERRAKKVQSSNP